ncbi:hypothetical protein G7Y89_g11266 [Cudoniella acicularis]|uniref:Uncharacterized protein n=1 Tax=Cudoniella acicularis TaxID=354080 RepID=A0A8H4RDJ3_9HELO|nr:hypothetical protein G7Y89_g11266 [Cudoniella acicularis]
MIATQQKKRKRNKGEATGEIQEKYRRNTDKPSVGKDKYEYNKYNASDKKNRSLLDEKRRSFITLWISEALGEELGKQSKQMVDCTSDKELSSLCSFTCFNLIGSLCLRYHAKVVIPWARVPDTEPTTNPLFYILATVVEVFWPRESFGIPSWSWASTMPVYGRDNPDSFIYVADEISDEGIVMQIIEARVEREPSSFGSVRGGFLVVQCSALIDFDARMFVRGNIIEEGAESEVLRPKPAFGVIDFEEDAHNTNGPLSLVVVTNGEKEGINCLILEAFVEFKGRYRRIGYARLYLSIEKMVLRSTTDPDIKSLATSGYYVVDRWTADGDPLCHSRIDAIHPGFQTGEECEEDDCLQALRGEPKSASAFFASNTTAPIAVPPFLTSYENARQRLSGPGQNGPQNVGSSGVYVGNNEAVSSIPCTTQDQNGPPGHTLGLNEVCTCPAPGTVTITAGVVASIVTSLVVTEKTQCITLGPQDVTLAGQVSTVTNYVTGLGLVSKVYLIVFANVTQLGFTSTVIQSVTSDITLPGGAITSTVSSNITQPVATITIVSDITLSLITVTTQIFSNITLPAVTSTEILKITLPASTTTTTTETTATYIVSETVTSDITLSVVTSTLTSDITLPASTTIINQTQTQTVTTVLVSPSPVCISNATTATSNTNFLLNPGLESGNTFPWLVEANPGYPNLGALYSDVSNSSGDQYLGNYGLVLHNFASGASPYPSS